jgi:hypothetical protein
MIDPDNLSSLSVASKTGFSEYARTTYKGAQMVLLEHAV